MLSFQAFAIGQVESISPSRVSGWACNPSNPGYSGWIHFWSGDKFVGATHANLQREQDVAKICGDSGAHGFLADLDSVDEVEEFSHAIRVYFINEDRSPTEIFPDLQKSASVPTRTTCNTPINELGWVLTDHGPDMYCSGDMRFPARWGYSYILNMPVGSEVAVCNLLNIPPGWRSVPSQRGTKSQTCQYSTGWGWEYNTLFVLKRMY